MLQGKLVSVILLIPILSRRIASSFEAAWRVVNEDASTSKLLGGLTLAEKMGLWNVEGADFADVQAERPEDSADLVDEEDEVYHLPHFAEARKFLIESKAFKWLLGRIETALNLTTRNGTIMERINDEICTTLSFQKALNREIYTAKFEINWRLLDFLREQQYENGEDQDISTIITLNGSAINAQAATCAQYMQQTWPVTGSETLRALQTTLAKKSTHTCNNIISPLRFLPLSTERE